MANRRMFSRSITSSSSFLMMPLSSQALYFQLGMNADDDGYVEHFGIMRITEAKPDDLKVLEAKKFVKVFDEKVLIISDWKENNYIPKDRYTPSKYLTLYTDCIHPVYKLETQVRLGKDRLDKNTTNAISSRRVGISSKAQPTALGFRTYDENNPEEEPTVDMETGQISEIKPKTAKYPNARNVMRLFSTYEKHWNMKRPILQAAERLFETKGLEKITRALEFYRANKDHQMCPRIYTPIDLEDKWQKLLDFRDRA